MGFGLIDIYKTEIKIKERKMRKILVLFTIVLSSVCLVKAQSNPLMLLFASPAATDTSHYVDANKILGGTDLSLNALDKLYLDGGNDTYIHESSSNAVSIANGGEDKWRFYGSSFWSVTSGSMYVLQAAGNATTPTYTFNNDTNTGMGREGVDQLSLIAGGTQIMKITTTGFSFPNIGTDSTAVAVGEFYINSGVLTMNYAD